jgi:hypothetical protein
MTSRTCEAPRHRRRSRYRAARVRYLVSSRPQFRGACWRAKAEYTRITVWRPRLGGQPRHAHDLGRQPLSLSDSALPMPDRVHPAARGHPLARRHLRQGIGGHRHARCGGHHTAAPVVVEPPPIGAIHHARHLYPLDPGLGQGTNSSIAHALQVPHAPRHNIFGQRVRANRPRLSLTLPCGDPTRAHAVAALLGVEAPQRHQRLITAQSAW